eukprot:gene14960-biopygen9682
MHRFCVRPRDFLAFVGHFDAFGADCGAFGSAWAPAVPRLWRLRRHSLGATRWAAGHTLGRPTRPGRPGRPAPGWGDGPSPPPPPPGSFGGPAWVTGPAGPARVAACLRGGSALSDETRGTVHRALFDRGRQIVGVLPS